MKKELCLVLLGVLVLIVTAAESHAANAYSGGLSNRFYRFNKPATITTLSGQQVYFHAIYFTVQSSTPGNVTATVTASGFTPRLHFYQNASFDPYDPLFNLYWLGSGSITATGMAHGIAIPHLLIVSGTNPNDVGSFTVTLTGPGAIVVDTNNDAGLTMRNNPRDASILAGQTATMGVFASGRQPQQFQWYVGPKPAGNNPPDPTKAIAGATNQTYTTPAMTQTTDYWVLITGANTTPATARSSEATVNVPATPANFSGSLSTQHDTWNRMTIINQPSGQICYFEVIPFRIFAAGTYNIALNTAGFPGSMNLYNGKFFPGTPAVNFLENGKVAASPGALNYSTILQPGDYELVVSSASSAQVGTYSGQITGPQVPQMLPRPTIPVFLNSPQNQTILTNTSATLSFAVEGAYPRTNQWYQGVPPDASMPIAGATGKSYTTPVFNTIRTNFYWARVANSFGAITSGPVRVQVVGGPVTFGGKLRPGNKVFQRSNGSGSLSPNLSHYKTFVFEANTLGTYAIALSAAGVNLQASLYNSIFLTNNPNVNLSLLPNTATFNLNVVSPSTYWLVLSTTNLAQSGTYSGSITGPSGATVNVLSAPTFATHPTPTNQFLWMNTDPAPFVATAGPVGGSWSWFPGVAGTPVDGLTEIAGLNTNTNDQPASVTAQPTNLWYWARLDGSYGYEDSELCRLEVNPPPRFLTYPTNRTIVYGQATNFATVVTNAPFLVRWYQAASPDETNAVQSDVIQGFGASYIRAAARTNTVPVLNAGTYSYWLQSTNPSGVTNGPTFTLTVAKRPLTVTLTVLPTNAYNSLPRLATATATDPTPGGPALPNPLPMEITYQLPFGEISTNPPVYAGTYQVIATVIHPNYTGSKTNSLTITKAALTARADNQTRSVGQTNPPLTVSYTGFINGDSEAMIDARPVASTAANTNSAAGQYPITVSGGTDDNYAFSFVNGTLTVLGLPVVVAWSSDFSTNAPLNGTLAGSAVLTNGALRLTATNNNQGVLFVPPLQQAFPTLHVEFDLFIGGGAVAADGFSFNYGLDATNTTTLAEEGFGTGLSILVDTYNNGGETVPNIGVKFGGVILAERVVPGVRSSTFNRFIVDVAPNGMLTLTFNGGVITNVALAGWQPLPEWRFSIGGRAGGGASDTHAVDNVMIGASASGVLLPADPCLVKVVLPPAFLPATNVNCSVASNDPTLATATMGTNGWATLTATNRILASSITLFRGSNSTVNAILPFTVEAVQPTILSVSHGTNGAARINLSGPANVRFYLQQSDTFTVPSWKTIAVGTLDANGVGAVSGLPYSTASMRCYRVQFVR